MYWSNNSYPLEKTIRNTFTSPCLTSCEFSISSSESFHTQLYHHHVDIKHFHPRSNAGHCSSFNTRSLPDGKSNDNIHINTTSTFTSVPEKRIQYQVRTDESSSISKHLKSVPETKTIQYQVSSDEPSSISKRVKSVFEKKTIQNQVSSYEPSSISPLYLSTFSQCPFHPKSNVSTGSPAPTFLESSILPNSKGIPTPIHITLPQAAFQTVTIIAPPISFCSHTVMFIYFFRPVSHLIRILFIS